MELVLRGYGGGMVSGVLPEGKFGVFYVKEVG